MSESNIQKQADRAPVCKHFINLTPEGFIPLIAAVMQDRRICAAEVARRTGMSRTIIGRSMAGQRKVALVEVQAMFVALEIDPMKALLAVGRFGEWQQYFDPDVEVLADLVDVLPPLLFEARSGSTRCRVSIAGAKVLAKRLSDMIAKHDAEAFRRQQEQPLYEA